MGFDRQPSLVPGEVRYGLTDDLVQLVAKEVINVLGNLSGDAWSHVAEPVRELQSDDPVQIHPPFLRTAHGDVTLT